MGAIRVKNLSVTLGNTLILNHLSFDITPGEKVFLVGPSGCGKTTLLRTIGGFLKPTEGRIELFEKDVSALPPHERGTPMVFQNYALWPHMTVVQNVSFALSASGIQSDESNSRSMEALGTVGLSQHAHKRPDQLSGGQQQRVALARALVLQPKIILLDEPFSNLDHHLRIEMRSELQRLQQKFGFTTVFVTHDREEALTLADRILMLNQGEIVQFASPRSFYTHPASRLAAQFMGDATIVEGQVSQLEPKILIDTAVGKLSGMTEAQLVLNQKVWLLIRPEDMALTRTSAEDQDLQSQIESILYKGSQIELTSNSGGIALKSIHRVRSDFQIGDKLSLFINPKSVWIMTQ